MTQVTHTHCVGTNQIQTGRCLVAASSRAVALHDNSASLLNTSKNTFPCSPYCQTPSHSSKVCPLWHLRKGSSREVSVAHPSHLSLSWQSQWAAVPAWNSPIREEKSPWLQEPKSPTGMDGWWNLSATALTCHLTKKTSCMLKYLSVGLPDSRSSKAEGNVLTS